MADSKVKFTEDELKSLQDLQNSYVNVTQALGQAEVQSILLQQRKGDLSAQYSSLQEREREIVQQLNEKYGPGQLDPQTGVFTPVPQEEAAAEEAETEDSSAEA